MPLGEISLPLRPYCEPKQRIATEGTIPVVWLWQIVKFHGITWIVAVETSARYNLFSRHI
jgi:hypothetical protein